MTYKYATQNIGENTAKACMTSQSISTKVSVETAKWLKGRTTKKALALLEGIKAKTVAVPFTRFNWDVGHKTGIGPGRYPQKVAEGFTKLIKAVEANAENKGLDTDNLVIVSLLAQRGTKTYRYGRIRGRKAKVTHIEVVAEVQEPKAKKAKPAKKVAKVTEANSEPKQESKPAKEDAKKDAPKETPKAESKSNEAEPKKEEAKSESPEAKQ